jgi:hypothetical protein
MVASSPEPVVLVYIRGVSQWWTIGPTVVTAVTPKGGAGNCPGTRGHTRRHHGPVPLEQRAVGRGVADQDAAHDAAAVARQHRVH